MISFRHSWEDTATSGPLSFVAVFPWRRIAASCSLLSVLDRMLSTPHLVLASRWRGGLPVLSWLRPVLLFTLPAYPAFRL